MRYSRLVYPGRDVELILEKTFPFMIWKRHKAHWMSIPGTEATCENAECRMDYSDDQTEWDLTDYSGGAQGILNEWGYDGTGKLRGLPFLVTSVSVSRAMCIRFAYENPGGVCCAFRGGDTDTTRVMRVASDGD